MLRETNVQLDTEILLIMINELKNGIKNFFVILHPSKAMIYER